MFINDLPHTIQKSIIDIYADDTTLSASADLKQSPSLIEENLQDDLNEVVKWTLDNKMILNATKTKSMLVTGKKLASKIVNTELNIKIDGARLDH